MVNTQSSGDMLSASVKAFTCHWHPFKKPPRASMPTVLHGCGARLFLLQQHLDTSVHGNLQERAELSIFPLRIYSFFICYCKLGKRHNKNFLSLAKESNMRCNLKLGVFVVSTILKKFISQGVASRPSLESCRRV